MTPAELTPADLLAAARGVLHEPSAVAAGGWPRMVALLTRQALEEALNEFWQAHPELAGLRRCSRKAQFTCLPFYLDPSVAREAAFVWSALSEACHYHAYELAPTAAELTGWLNAVTALTQSMKMGEKP
jgi:hypothetical protein